MEDRSDSAVAKAGSTEVVTSEEKGGTVEEGPVEVVIPAVTDAGAATVVL